TPGLATLPPKLGWIDMMLDDVAEYWRRVFHFSPFTVWFNITGQPAMMLPLGVAGDLPVAVQVVARYGDEATLCRLAAQLETARPWFDRRPAVARRAVGRPPGARLALLAVLLCGCSSHVTPYPTAWPALSLGGLGCHDVAGTYAQAGERGPGGRSGEDPPLMWLATGKENPAAAGSIARVSFPEADVFEIKGGDVA